MNFFNLFTPKKRFKVINKFKFPFILIIFEIYLNIINYLRNYII